MYEEALTIELAAHLEQEHGQKVSLTELAPVVRRTMPEGAAARPGSAPSCAANQA